MDVITAIHTRRSIRSYRPEGIDRATIADLIFAAAQAPSPTNSGAKPWRFAVVEGLARIAAYGAKAHAYARANQPPGNAWSWPERPGFKVFWDAPVLVVIAAEHGNAEAPAGCIRAGQNLMLAAHAMGLGSCWVGAPLPWLKSPGVAEEVGLPADCDPVAVIVLGHPAETPAGNPRPRPEIVWCNDAAA